jgi:hypothetical protein
LHQGPKKDNVYIVQEYIGTITLDFLLNTFIIEYYWFDDPIQRKESLNVGNDFWENSTESNSKELNLQANVSGSFLPAYVPYPMDVCNRFLVYLLLFYIFNSYKLY